MGEHHIVAMSISPAAREAIERNGGKIEVLREAFPHLELITVVDATVNGKHNYEDYYSCELANGGLCWFNADEVGRKIYSWNGNPNDPDIDKDFSALPF